MFALVVKHSASYEARYSLVERSNKTVTAPYPEPDKRLPVTTSNITFPRAQLLGLLRPYRLYTYLVPKRR